MVHPDTARTDETENEVHQELEEDMDLLDLKVLSAHLDCVIQANAIQNSQLTPRDLMEARDLSQKRLLNRPKRLLM